MVNRPQLPRGVSVNAKTSWFGQNMTVSVPTSTSFDMLARFQQKQLQEKEQKLLQLYDQQQQRAHQVAQRGSAGSNGSNGSSHGSGITNHAGKVRQTFDERRTKNAKGIDKSYPLEPLKKHAPAGNNKTTSKANTANRRTVAKRVTTRDEVSTDSTNNTTTATRDSFFRDSYASSRGSSLYQESISQRENISRESYHAADYNDLAEHRLIGQLNGYARNGQHYEINIDEVIDNEAMQRNRMLAKFQPEDLDKRRRFSGDIESEEFPEDMLHDVPDKVSEKSNVSRKSSLTETRAAAERLKHTNSTRKSNAEPTTTRKPSISTGANARQSTVMQTTKSASLKVRKLPPHLRKEFGVARSSKKTLLERKVNKKTSKSSQVKENPEKEDVTQKSDDCVPEKSFERSLPTDWESLKSTSLVCKIIRSHSLVEQFSKADGVGKVNKIITEIESRTTDMKKSTDMSKSNEKKISKTEPENVFSPSTSNKRPSILDSDLCKGNATEIVIDSQEKNKETILKNIENEDQGDGLTSLKETKITTIHQNRELSVEHPTDRQEITIADQSIKVERDNARRLSEECANRVRRASFELKRMMFEQIQNHEKFSRRDSVKSALRHFDSIGADVTDSSELASIATVEKRKSETTVEKNIDNPPKETDHSIIRLCSKDAIKKESRERLVKGFERHTSAWSIKTQNYPKTSKEIMTSTSSKRALSRTKVRKSPSKKLFEARDSIELARVTVKTKLPACRRKIAQNLIAAEKTQTTGETAENTSVPASIKQQTKSDEAMPVKSQSFQQHDSQVARLKSMFSSEQTPKTDQFPPSTTRNSTVKNSISRKNVAPYPSSKSPVDNNNDERSRPAVTKLNRATASSNGDIAGENGFSTAARKSSMSAVDGPYSAIDSENKSPDDEKSATAPRTTSSLSSSSSIGTTRSQRSTGARPSPKAKITVATPTPALRSNAPEKTAGNGDSLITCKICNRRFASERITLHEQICAKAGQKKRKQFDTLTHRIRGTELEAFVVPKPVGKKQLQSKTVKPVEPPKSNWRRKHEDFINAIRSAKQMQVHLASGGKLSDLPPPPASDNSDYVQCPHCSRKFNQSVAERHIPKCATMQHNKPKTGAPARFKR